MLHRAQSLKAWRSVLAIALPPGLLVAASIGLLVLSFSAQAAAANAARTQALVTAAQARSTATGAAVAARRTNLEAVAVGLQTMSAAEGGGWPGHGLHLLANGSVLPHQFMGVTSDTMNLTPEWPISAVAVLGKDQLAQLADQLAATLPPNVVAHRVGDMVFTYHGIDPQAPDQGDLWLAVEVPSAGQDGSLMVLTADGIISPVLAVSLPAAIMNQNQLRILHNLPPIPDPRTITQDQPATSP